MSSMDESRQKLPISLSCLENLRVRLLDLSARNRLLSYRHRRTGNIRIIDELPDALHELLLTEEELRFMPVPEPTQEQLIESGYIEVNEVNGLEERIKKTPTAEEWARRLGLQDSYELPRPEISGAVPEKHRDKAIQTLLFPFELETRLRDLRSKAETAIEETGANILHLALGFLEWFESPDSDTPYLAPLMLIPVRLTKGRINRQRGIYEYTISYSGEDIFPNLSLKEKLRLDFGLVLPEFDEHTKPEYYFTEVEMLIGLNQPRWRVCRYATVGLFNFSKLLMYLDLDPKRWPEDKPITTHPIIQHLCEGKEPVVSDTDFSVEYGIDDLPQIHERYPLIEDADSSQHSTLIDAVNGENLVVEGPPGTGKSQTIANLIAAALAQGKTVLFVAEKLAALEVVKRRLDRAGLGDFCLELHSHKTQKRRVLDDIKSRLDKHYRASAELETDIARFEDLKKELKEHAERINSLWKNTDKSIHEILATATRYRRQLDVEAADLHPEDVSGETFAPMRQRQLTDLIQVYRQVYMAVAGQMADSHDFSSHPWYGVANTDLQLFDAKRVCDALNVWLDALRIVDRSLRQSTALFNEGECEIPESIGELRQLVEDLVLLPQLHGDEHLHALPLLRDENLKAYGEYLSRFKEIQRIYESLSKDITPPLIENLTLAARVESGSAALKKLGIDQGTGLSAVVRLIQKIDSLEEQLKEIDKHLSEIAPAIGAGAHDILAMHERGLLELQTFLDIVMALEPGIWKYRDPRFDDEEMDEVLSQLKTGIVALKNHRSDLSETFKVDRLPPAPELEEIQFQLTQAGPLRWLKGRWRSARKRLLAIAANSRQGLTSMLPTLHSLVIFAKDMEVFDGDKKFVRLLGEHFQGIETPVDQLIAIRSWYGRIRKIYGLGFGPRVPIGQALIDMPTEVGKGLRSVVQQGLIATIGEAMEKLTQLKAELSNSVELRRGDILLIGEQGLLPRLREELKRNLSLCQEYLLDTDMNIGDVDALMAETLRLQGFVNEWTESSIDSTWFKGSLGLAIGSGRDNEAAMAAAEHTQFFASALNETKTPALKTVICNHPERLLVDKLLVFCQKMKQELFDQDAALEKFSKLTELDFLAWIRQSGDKVRRVIERNEQAVRNPEWLANWLDYARIRQSVVESGFKSLVFSVEKGSLKVKDIAAGYQLGVYDLLSREIFRENPWLRRFSGDVQETLQKQFGQYDENLKLLQRSRIAWLAGQRIVPRGIGSGKADAHTERSLLERECNKKKRHIPIRQLIKRAAKALVALKPCFMMGPMSVAQYLPPGELEFDIVVMDEASQMRPEDALGASARGRQLIVVGDPKQLPPTSFFDKLIESGDEDVAVLEESESILDAAMPLFKRRRLKWHYRSRHESLIAFSNQAFYKEELVLFPSPCRESDEYGVKFTRVHRGRFINRRNMEEARVIAEAVREHFLDRPDESLGVVAMSAEQRDQIESALEMLSKEDELLQLSLQGDQNRIEPLFIKNLENVQGDERDVMFISMTYGPQEIKGPVMQRFGPINTDNGWRRLNVLFTRARKRMHVFSSMSSEDVVPTEGSKGGVRALKDFLAYAETGILHKAARLTNRPPDSDFEIAVVEALRDHGFECLCQVGVAGYFIDIAISDPGNPGRYLMGIECDGANYHSAKSVRDRDHLRQMILERLGWRIRRIWSTDWYKNPHAQLQPIIRELNALKTEAPCAPTVGPEVEEIEAILEKIEEEEAQALQSADVGSLRDRLLRFDQDVIRKEYPDTPENKRLLRPAMLEALLEYFPASKWEFLEKIPPHLRQATSADDGRYLAQVLEIIADAES